MRLARSARPGWARVVLAAPVLTALVAIIVWQFYEYEISEQVRQRDAMQRLADGYAAELRQRLQRSISSTWSLGAVMAVLRNDSLADFSSFDEVAKSIVNSFGGITNLQLAPGGIVETIYPLREQDERVIGLNLLADPLQRSQALRAIREQREQRPAKVYGPLRLLQGGIGFIARHAVFSAHAPEFVASKPWTDPDGETHAIDCSTPELAAQNCRFPGPANQRGMPTYCAFCSCPYPPSRLSLAACRRALAPLTAARNDRPPRAPLRRPVWGFVTALATVDDLFAAILAKLEGETLTTLPSFVMPARQEEERGANKSLANYTYQLRAKQPHASLADAAGVFVHSAHAPANATLDDAVSADILLPEYEVALQLLMRPHNGFPSLSSTFLFKLIVVLCFTVASALLLCALVVNGLRSAARAREAAERDAAEKRELAASAARALLVRSVLHDLRSPLLSISVIASEMHATPRPSAHEEQLVSTLSLCARFMEGLLSDMCARPLRAQAASAPAASARHRHAHPALARLLRTSSSPSFECAPA